MVVTQHSLSLFCLSVAYGLLSHLSNPPLRLQLFMFLCIRFYILVLETADLVFANPKAEIRGGLWERNVQVGQLYSGSAANRREQSGAAPQGRRGCGAAGTPCSRPRLGRNAAEPEKYRKQDKSRSAGLEEPYLFIDQVWL